MPAVDRGETQGEREKEREEKGGGSGEKGKSKPSTSSSKTKDLSHVPCKFFKVGSCTAGSSCPFSHNVSEPGAAKDVCAWFVKGNCKFGHKCALAHILPGQSMAWDRKNKKAAQVAAGGGKEGKGGKGKRDTQGRPPITMSLKASISPSAPAPALKDTDFASFSALDESQKLPSAPAQGRPSQDSSSPVETKPDTTATSATATAIEYKSPPGIPLSSPRRANPSSPKSSNPPIDYGPIGSPPRSASSTSHPHPMSRLNGSQGGFSPGTSPSGRLNGTGNVSGTPTNNHLSTSPFSPPGQPIFNPESGRQGVAASLGGLGILGGHGRPSWGSVGTSSDIGSLPNLSQSHGPEQNRNNAGGKDAEVNLEYEEYLGSGIGGGAAARRAAALAASGVSINLNSREGSTDDDLEDFIPGSLTDLLTPEERSRRMSRSNSGQDSVSGGPISPTRRALGVPLRDTGGSSTPGANGGGHRYSRSVPAPSLLGDISSIWAPKEDINSNGLPSSPSARALGNGTPSSFTSATTGTSAFGGRGAFDPLGTGGDELLATGEWAAGMSLSPSNASAAFLPGLHYLKAKQAQQLGRGARGVSSPLIGAGGQGSNLNSQAGTPRTTSNGFDQLNANNSLSSTDRVDNDTSYTRPIPHHLPPSNAEDPHVLSPSARALQAHAPGQSLPQGLAAGYSRIHAIPAANSPSNTSGFGSYMGSVGVSPGLNNTFSAGPFGTAKDNWISSATNPSVPPGLGLSANGGANYGLNPNAQAYSGPYNTFSALNNPGVAGAANNGGQQAGQGQGQGAAGQAGSSELDAMLSKLSYSAAASKGAPSGAVLSPQKVAQSTSTGSSGSGWGAPAAPAGVSSPLSGPVVTRDDELFEFDG
ncbi:hypothetical protein D9758_011025 [Tetrapyrgos nigripes]|uniref:C3H1-type domain-containing protein n=1 Tax=Tetrapyrgos nigripes TaxID=182062 RepID=A0A8H5GHM5_9AGAR|nr:hypothetical protein D9758_011025 [Tetrapyrgos nigripes]